MVDQSCMSHPISRALLTASTANALSRSCSLCKKRKIRCNRKSPCNNCIRSKNEVTCFFQNGPSISSGSGSSPLLASAKEPLLAMKAAGLMNHDGCIEKVGENNKSGPSTLVDSSSADAASPALLRAYSEKSDLQEEKIRQLEEQLSKLTSSSPSRKELPKTLDEKVRTTCIARGICGTIHMHDVETNGKLNIVRAITHKNRTFGQSHWTNGIILVSVCIILYGSSI